MQARWVGKNVDLALLSQCVEDFFENRGFKTAKDRSTEGYTVSGKPQRGGDILGLVIVRILGSSHDFSIEFSTSKHTRSAIRSGFLTTMFGGGILLLRGLKSQEALEKLEKEFWVYIEEEMPHLIDSTS